MLFCDWNVAMYCITAAKYNASRYTWEKIKYHLQDLRGNITLDVKSLKREIFNTFKSKLPGISYNHYKFIFKTLESQFCGLV
jgi:hypothetical protein